MRVERVVFGSLQGRGDGAAEKKGYNVVRLLIRLRLIVREHDQSALVEGLIGQQRLEKLVRPFCRGFKSCVMAVVHHVWRQKRKLGHPPCGQCPLEIAEREHPQEAVPVVGDTVKAHERAVVQLAYATRCSQGRLFTCASEHSPMPHSQWRHRCNSP
jgi:hypothetical protein